MIDLEEVFHRIAAAGLKLSSEKFPLFNKEANYLKSSGNEQVKDWTRNFYELLSSLGLYNRRFVSDFTSVANCLHELT